MYLATTALSEFWNKKQKILFLSQWCLLHNMQEEWKDLDYEIMENIWNNRELFFEAGLYTDKLYEKYLKILSLLLNKTHGVDFTENYWRIIIGPWLFHYIGGFYDRYCHIHKAFDEYRDLETVLLDPTDYITPISYSDFVYLFTEDDRYNLQWYSQILKEMGFNFPTHSYQKEIKKKKNRFHIIKKEFIQQNNIFYKKNHPTYMLVKIRTKGCFIRYLFIQQRCFSS